MTICANPAECCKELTRIWNALGVEGYTGDSASGHVARLQQEIQHLRTALAADAERLRAAEARVWPEVGRLRRLIRRAALRDLKRRIAALPDDSRGLDGEPNGFAIEDLIDEMIVEAKR